MTESHALFWQSARPFREQNSERSLLLLRGGGKRYDHNRVPIIVVVEFIGRDNYNRADALLLRTGPAPQIHNVDIPPLHRPLKRLFHALRVTLRRF